MSKKLIEVFQYFLTTSLWGQAVEQNDKLAYIFIPWAQPEEKNKVRKK